MAKRSIGQLGISDRAFIYTIITFTSTLLLTKNPGSALIVGLATYLLTFFVLK